MRTRVFKIGCLTVVVVIVVVVVVVIIAIIVIILIVAAPIFKIEHFIIDVPNARVVGCSLVNGFIKVRLEF